MLGSLIIAYYYIVLILGAGVGAIGTIGAIGDVEAIL